MKMMIYILAGFIIVSSCATSRAKESAGSLTGKEKKLAEEAGVRQAVESKRFIIKFNRLYTPRGGNIDLIPSKNYLILNGEKAIINAAYIGRQRGLRPIAGIDMIGRTNSLEVRENTAKGEYNIKMKVSNSKSAFDIYITVTRRGNCYASVSNPEIDNMRYAGKIVPVRSGEPMTEADSTMI